MSQTQYNRIKGIEYGQQTLKHELGGESRWRLTWSCHAVRGLGRGVALGDGGHGGGGAQGQLGLGLQTQSQHLTPTVPRKGNNPTTSQTCISFYLPHRKRNISGGRCWHKHQTSNKHSHPHTEGLTLPSAPCPPSGPRGMDKETYCREKENIMNVFIFITVTSVLRSGDGLQWEAG